LRPLRSLLLANSPCLNPSACLQYDATELKGTGHCLHTDKSPARSPGHLGYRLLCLLRSCRHRARPDPLSLQLLPRRQSQSLRKEGCQNCLCSSASHKRVHVHSHLFSSFLLAIWQRLNRFPMFSKTLKTSWPLPWLTWAIIIG
jgi:hypothetical protein